MHCTDRVAHLDGHMAEVGGVDRQILAGGRAPLSS